MAYNPGNPNGQATSANSAPVVLASDQSAVPIKESYLSVPFTTTTAQVLGSYDAMGNGYRYVSVHINTQGTNSNVTFQTSDDNTNWLSNTLMASVATNVTGAVSTGAPGVMYSGAIYGRYFRLSVTAITAGTTAGTIVYSAIPLSPVTVGGSVALSTSSNLVGMVGLSANLSATSLSSFTSFSLSNTVTAVKSTTAHMHEYDFYNPNPSGVWVQLFSLVPGSVTLGTTTPNRAIYIPATSGRDWASPYTASWSGALSVACTTTSTGSTAPASPIQAYIGYI